MQDEVRPASSLDCVGLFCPEPLFQTREAIDGLAPARSSRCSQMTRRPRKT